MLSSNDTILKISFYYYQISFPFVSFFSPGVCCLVIQRKITIRRTNDLIVLTELAVSKLVSSGEWEVKMKDFVLEFLIQNQYKFSMTF